MAIEFLNGINLEGTLELKSLTTNTDSTTALVMSGNEVQKRTLGTAAFADTTDFTTGNFVTLDTDQSITGNKTFSGTVGGMPAIEEWHFVTKGYVDSESGEQNVQANWTATSGDSFIKNKPTTFAPSAHNQAWSTITSTPTTLAGYGITDIKPEYINHAVQGDHDMHTWDKVHAVYSDNGGSSTYWLITTNVPQDNYSMGGFELIFEDHYSGSKEGGTIKIYGYWNPESNGGFTGFKYTTDNPNLSSGLTIEVGRNSSGKTCFQISGHNQDYAQIIAKNLWLGYSASSADSTWGDSWSILTTNDPGLTNLNTLTKVPDARWDNIQGKPSLLAIGTTATTAMAGNTSIPTVPSSYAPTDAEANVQANWTATSGDAHILNKPTIPTVPSSYAPTNAEQNVQSDWNATSGDAQILNKLNREFKPNHWGDDRFVRAVGVAGAETGDKWVHLSKVGITGGYEKVKIEFTIGSYDDNARGDERITVLYENHSTAQEGHILHWYSGDQIPTLFKAVKSIRSASSGLTNTYDLYVQIDGAWKDSFTVHAEWWKTHTGDSIIKYPTTVGEIALLEGSEYKFLTTRERWIDAYKLDGQQGTYYLDYDNFNNTPTIPTDYGNHASGGYMKLSSTTEQSIEGEVLFNDDVQFDSYVTIDSGMINGTMTMSTQFALVADNYGRGVFGKYSDTKYQHVWGMGTSWKLSDDGSTTGNLYGIAYTHSNIGGQSKAGLSHQTLFMINGVTETAIGRGMWTKGLITTTDYGTSANWKTAYDHSQAAHAPTNAEQNVQADWTATSGDSFIVNKPTTFAPSAHNHDDRYYTETETSIHTAAAKGWVPAYSNAVVSSIKWNFTENALEIQTNDDSTTGVSFQARRVKAGEIIKITFMAKGSAAASNGVYFRLYQHNGNMPDGKTHVSNDESGSSVLVQEDDAIDQGWYENKGITTSWVTYERNYTAAADGYVSLVILNWAGLGTNSLYITNPDIQGGLAIGTTSTTALAGNTALLAIGTTATTAMAGNTSIPTVPSSYAPTDAEANVQADWTAADGDAHILNKPTIPTDYGDHASEGYLTSLPSHNHDDRYYTEAEMNTFFNRGYINKFTKGNVAVGWYTIATNTGDRAMAEFQIWDIASSDHQSVLFNASHHFGQDHSNDITVLNNSRYSGTNFRYIRIKDHDTYAGAAIQVYVDAATNSVNVAIVGGNAQESGWVIKDWIPDATDPGSLSNWSSFGERTKVDLDLIMDGGILTTGEIFAGSQTTQNKVFHAGNFTDSSTAWNAAHGWGNHADAGYITTDNNTTYNFAGTTFTSRNSTNAIAIDSATVNMTGYTTDSEAAGFADGGLFVAAYSTSWVSQIFSNFRTGELSARGKNSGTWQAWRTIHDSGHFTVAEVQKGVDAYGWGNHADSGYLTSYTDTNTQLTTAQIAAMGYIKENEDRRHKVLRFTGEGTNSNNSAINYGIYQAGGAWSHPYPDLVIAMHTGIKIGGYPSYGGTRFYSDAPERSGAVELMSVGNGNANVNITNNLTVGGPITASGTTSLNWKEAYGWGNHADFGYLESLPSHNHDTLYLGKTAKAADSELIDGIDSSRIVYGANAKRSTRYDGEGIAGKNQNSGFFYGHNPDGGPTTDWTNWMTTAGASWSSSNNYSFTLAHPFHSDILYVARMTNGEQGSWRQILDTSTTQTITGVKTFNSMLVNGNSTVMGTLNVGSAADGAQRDLILHGSSVNKQSRLRTTNGNLHIDSAEGHSLYLNYYYGATTNIYFGSGNGGSIGSISSGGLLRMANDIVAYYSFSDKRLKTDIKSTEGNLDKILSLNPVEYTWKEGPRKGVKEIGLIAQEVEEIVPEVVRVQSRHDNETGDGIEYKQVDYEHLVSTLIGAMQEQQKQIDELKSMMCKCKK